MEEKAGNVTHLLVLFPFRYDEILPRTKVFVHLLSLITQVYDSVTTKTIWVSESALKNLSFASNLTAVAQAVWK